MSEATFQVGDRVEVLPAPEGAGFTWRMVGRRQGTVNCIDTSRPCSRTVGVLFQDGSAYFCDPAWLRRLGGGACGHWGVVKLNCGARVCKAAGCWQEFKQGGRHDPGQDAHDATSRPQDARSAPEQAKPDPHKPGPRYRVGDLVDMGQFLNGEVLDVDAEPRYSVQWPAGHVQRIKESTLRLHVDAPAKCAPDGTRCTWMENTTHRLGETGCWWHFCASCGGKLKEG